MKKIGIKHFYFFHGTKTENISNIKEKGLIYNFQKKSWCLLGRPEGNFISVSPLTANYFGSGGSEYTSLLLVKAPIGNDLKIDFCSWPSFYLEKKYRI